MNYNIVVMENFGQWLKRHRKALDLKQDEIAKRAGVSVSYVSTLEREQPHSQSGARITPERDKVERLARAVQGDLDEALLLCGYASKTASAVPPDFPILFHGYEKWSEQKQKAIAELIRKDIDFINSIMPDEE